MLTSAGPEIASAREFFYQMYDLLLRRGVDVSLNNFDESRFDIIIVHWPKLELIKRALEHSPLARIGILSPGGISYVEKPSEEQKILIDNSDFFIVTSFLWRERLLKFGNRVHEVFDYELLNNWPMKNHEATENLVIGYHGNCHHYTEDFFPHGARALEKLAKKYKFSLTILTDSLKNQRVISGVETNLIKWELGSRAMHQSSFDIGICPAFADMEMLADPNVFIRNPNRVMTLLHWGIPSVASPLPQACHHLEHNKTVLFAVSEAGWADGLERLITQPKLRSEIGSAGKKIVEEEFSAESAVERFLDMLGAEFLERAKEKSGIPKKFLKAPRPMKMLRVAKRIQSRVSDIIGCA